MSREKQIEEMAKDICKLGISCEECTMLARKTNQTKEQYCKAFEYAKRAYNAGYRKQSEGEWIFEHKFYGKMLCSNCKEEALVNECNEYVDSDFCPNCGAKMRGEKI